MRIDLNSDVGESLGPWPMGHDEPLIPELTSVSIACGFHAGDPLTIERTVRMATEAGAAIGAHPGYPDLLGFGRRDLDMAPDELGAAVVYQVAALAGFARAAGRELTHVKPHGALYNRAARDPAVAEVVARAVRRFSVDLLLVGLAGSVGLEAARSTGLRVVAEAFADRAYESDGTLRSRRLPGAVLTDPASVADQAVRLVREGRVRTGEGQELELWPETLCIHGDTPGAAEIARTVRTALTAAGVEVRSLVGS